MPKTDMPSGALTLLILRVLKSGPLHGYAIAQRIHTLSSEVLQVEEGALYPALHQNARRQIETELEGAKGKPLPELWRRLHEIRNQRS